MSSKRYTEEFKIEAVKQITERGYPVQEVAERLGVTAHSLYSWRKKYGQGSQQAVQMDDQQAEIKRLKAGLRRVTEERDILKKATTSSTGQCNTLLEFLCRRTKIQRFFLVSDLSVKPPDSNNLENERNDPFSSEDTDAVVGLYFHLYLVAKGFEV